MDDKFKNFENDDFDPIAHLNYKFPDEESLKNLDEEITAVK